MSDKSNQETCPGCKRKRCCECYKPSSNADLTKMVRGVIREHGNYTKSGCCGAKILILPSPHGSDFNISICRKCTKECFGRECEQLWVIPKTDPNASVSESKVINLLSKPAPWQERFDEEFPDGAWSDPDSLAIDISDEIKSFIKSELDKRDGEWVKAVVNQPPMFIKNNIVDVISMDTDRVVRRVRCVEILREMGKTKEADKLLKETRELSDLLRSKTE